jgi:hypothetical protein
VITVHFACNDSRGNFAGVASAADFQGVDDSHVSLLSPYLDSGEVLGLDDSALTIHGRSYPCSRRRRWTGNMAWDSVDIQLEDARSLFVHLLNHSWTVDEADEEGPLSDLVNNSPTPKPEL